MRNSRSWLLNKPSTATKPLNRPLMIVLQCPLLIPDNEYVQKMGTWKWQESNDAQQLTSSSWFSVDRCENNFLTFDTSLRLLISRWTMNVVEVFADFPNCNSYDSNNQFSVRQNQFLWAEIFLAQSLDWNILFCNRKSINYTFLHIMRLHVLFVDFFSC